MLLINLIVVFLFGTHPGEDSLEVRKGCKKCPYSAIQNRADQELRSILKRKNEIYPAHERRWKMTAAKKKVFGFIAFKKIKKPKMVRRKKGAGKIVRCARF